ncbi:MAG: hypothetical protein ACI9FD_001931 [Gammaproteobacteria bacterium]|jgi:hypothetical protein
MNVRFDSILKVALVGVVLLILSACASTGGPKNGESYPEKYLAATQEFERSESSDLAVPDDLANFKKIFYDLKDPNLAEYIEQGYSDSLYFNDTVKSLSSREELSRYLLETAEKVDYTRVYFNEVVKSGDNYFLLWKMETRFSAMGKQIEADSIGMSQVRLDSQGKVNFHQDFWDSAEGLYRHLPVVGYLVNKTRNQL